ncbi:MAG TPA: hypothetical protein DCQ98_20660 [Planctomycetaceae bacterium]|nr:hypothetical protein [Planctomycetaceae bacterium]HRE99705.1 hypothetical protein [Pirellulaceae bacterium]
MSDADLLSTDLRPKHDHRRRAGAVRLLMSVVAGVGIGAVISASLIERNPLTESLAPTAGAGAFCGLIVSLARAGTGSGIVDRAIGGATYFLTAFAASLIAVAAMS